MNSVVSKKLDMRKSEVQKRIIESDVELRVTVIIIITITAV